MTAMLCRLWRQRSVGLVSKERAEAVVRGVLAEQHKRMMDALVAAALDRLKRVKAPAKLKTYNAPTLKAFVIFVLMKDSDCNILHVAFVYLWSSCQVAMLHLQLAGRRRCWTTK